MARQWSIFINAVFFVLGFSVIFSLVGVLLQSVLSNVSFTVTQWLGYIGGTVIIFFGIYLLGLVKIPFLEQEHKFKVKRKFKYQYATSFVFGSAFAVGWTPCVGPILVALLLLASTTSSVLTGGLLLFMYAVGLAIPLILISTYLEKINKESRLWKIIEGKELHIKFGNKIFSIHTNNLISGLLFIIMGYLIFSGILFAFNQYVAATSFQKFIYGIEDLLLGLIK